MRIKLTLIIAILFCTCLWGRIRVKGAPFATYDTDEELGIGFAGMALSYIGERDNPDWQIFLKPSFTTAGVYNVDLDFDHYNVTFNSKTCRFHTFLNFNHSKFEPFYDQIDGTVDDFTSYLNRDDHYYHYEKTRTCLAAEFFYPIKSRIAFVELGAYITFGEFASTDPLSAFAINSPYGAGGGLDNGLKAGIIFDTRDLVNNPRHGIYHEFTISGSFKLLGSEYDYSRLYMDHRQFVPLIREPKLVLAMRLSGDQTFGDSPFFALEEFGASENFPALGGGYSIRGMPMMLLSGTSRLLISNELRFRLFSIGPILGDMWHAEPLVFADIGGAWFEPEHAQLTDLQVGYGIGGALCWGEDFVVTLDIGLWRDQFGVYADFGHQF